MCISIQFMGNGVVSGLSYDTEQIVYKRFVFSSNTIRPAYDTDHLMIQSGVYSISYQRIQKLTYPFKVILVFVLLRKPLP